MDTRRKRTGARSKPAPAAKPVVKRPVIKDMSVYARHLRLPQYPGFTTVSKLDVGHDVRSMLGMPTGVTWDPERDPFILSSRDAGPAWAEGKGQLPRKVMDRLRDTGAAYASDIDIESACLEEKPEIVTSLETAVFRGEIDEDMLQIADGDEEYDDLALPAPAKVMSGWAAARLASEGGAARLTTSRAPLMGNSTSITASAALGALPTASVAAITFGEPRGAAAGAALGMDGARLNLGLVDRMVGVLPTRRIESATRQLSLRRQYVALLKSYFVEATEMGVSLEELKAHASSIRRGLRPGARPAAFASDEEEWAAVDRMAHACKAVVRQNAQLRERLAEATGRVSGNAGEAEAAAAEGVAGSSASAVNVVHVIDPTGVTIMGGVHPVVRSAAQQGAVGGGAAKEEDEAMALPTRPDHPYVMGSRSTPRSLASTSSSPPTRAVLHVRAGTGGVGVHAPHGGSMGARDPVLAMGDLVLTPYGRGVAIKQRDVRPAPGDVLPNAAGGPIAPQPQPHPPSASPVTGAGGKAVGRGSRAKAATSAPPAPSSSASSTDGQALLAPSTTSSTSFVEVALTFGARAVLTSSQVVLLAVAGEKYTGPVSADKVLLAAVLASRARAAGRPTLLTGLLPSSSSAYIAPTHADDLLFGPPQPVSQEAQAAAKAGQGGAGASQGHPSVPAAKAKTATGTSILHGLQGGSSTSDVAGEAAWDRSAAERMEVHMAAVDGVSLSHRVPVFRTSWERNLIPRGVPLVIDPLRGTTSQGYIVGQVTVGGGHGMVEGGIAVPGAGPGRAAAGEGEGVGAAGAGAVPTPHPLTSEGSPSSLCMGGAGMHGPPRTGDATQQVRELFAEVQRLRGQLRTSEESRTDQRKRLTDARMTHARLLEQLSDTRSQQVELNAEVNRREKEVGDLQERIHELRARFEPQALAADEANAAEAERVSSHAGAGAAATKAMEALVASMSAEAEGEGGGEAESETDADMAGGAAGPPTSRPALNIHASPLKTVGGLPSSSPGARLSAGTASRMGLASGLANSSSTSIAAMALKSQAAVSGRKAMPGAGYRGIMGAAEAESDSDKEDGEEGEGEEGEGLGMRRGLGVGRRGSLGAVVSLSQVGVGEGEEDDADALEVDRVDEEGEEREVGLGLAESAAGGLIEALTGAGGLGLDAADSDGADMLMSSLGAAEEGGMAGPGLEAADAASLGTVPSEGMPGAGRGARAGVVGSKRPSSVTAPSAGVGRGGVDALSRAGKRSRKSAFEEEGEARAGEGEVEGDLLESSAGAEEAVTQPLSQSQSAGAPSPTPAQGAGGGRRGRSSLRGPGKK